MLKLFNIQQIVNSVLGAFFTAFNDILIAAATFIWKYLIFQFLNPAVSFPSVLNNGKIPSLNPVWITGNAYGYGMVAQIGMDFSVNISVIVLNFIVAPFFSIMLILAGLSYLFKHTFQINEKLSEYIPRIFLSVILAYFSIYIADITMQFGNVIYSFFYSGLHIVWNGSPSPVIGLKNLSDWPWNYFQNFNIMIYSTNGFIEFLVLSTLIGVMFIFLIVLVMRIIWIYFFIIILPIGSLFLMHPKTELVGKRIWMSFIDRVFEICFMAPLLLLLIFIQDPLFWSGIFAVSLMVPYVVSFSLSKMGYPRTISFFPRIFFFEGSNIGKTGFKTIKNSISGNFSLLPKNSGENKS